MRRRLLLTVFTGGSLALAGLGTSWANHGGSHGGQNGGVLVCHQIGGPNNTRYILQPAPNQNALDAHLGHGDVLPDSQGRCPGDPGFGTTPGTPAATPVPAAAPGAVPELLDFLGGTSGDVDASGGDGGSARGGDGGRGGSGTLPICNQNTNDSGTWVDVYDEDGYYIESYFEPAEPSLECGAGGRGGNAGDGGISEGGDAGLAFSVG